MSRPAPSRLLWLQFRNQNRVFLRNPFSAFFSLAFPLMFLLLFGSLFGSEETIVDGHSVPVAQFITAQILVFAVVSTAYINITTAVAINRDEGVLKRVRGTPLPPWVYIAARVASAVWWSLAASALMVTAGVLLFGVEVVWRLLPATLVTVLLGTACFCALGVAAASLTSKGESAPVVANFTALPILFVSGVFIPLDNAPGWVKAIGDVFPVKHTNDAIRNTFNPFSEGSGFYWADLGIVAAWLLVGILIAVRFFRWAPRDGAVRPRR